MDLSDIVVFIESIITQTANGINARGVILNKQLT